MRALLHLPVLLSALLAPLGGAHAQDSDEPDWYTIELLLFEHLVPDNIDAEHWSDDPGYPDLSQSIEPTVLDPAMAEEEALDASAQRLPHAYRLLDAGHLSLADKAAYMRRSRYYRPVLHLAWRQQGLDRDAATAVHLRSDMLLPGELPDIPAETVPGSPAAEAEAIPAFPTLDGYVRLYRGRYLHVETDLLYFREPPASTNTALDAEGEMAQAEELLLEELPTTLFRMQASRRMRSQELHYLDHPLFGMLVTTNRYEIPEPPVTAEVEQEDIPAPAATGGNPAPSTPATSKP